MKEKDSKFVQWFIQQHGKRPSNLPYEDLVERFKKLHVEMLSARSLLDRCKEWDEKMNSALYAWRIKDADK